MAIIEFIVDLQDYTVELEQYVVDDYVEEAGAKSATVINGGKLIEASPNFDALFNSAVAVEITKDVAVNPTTVSTMIIDGDLLADANITLESIINLSLMAARTTTATLDILSEGGFLLPRANITKPSSVTMQAEFTKQYVTDVIDPESGVITTPSVVQLFEVNLSATVDSVIRPISYIARGTRTLEAPLLPYRISHSGSFNVETLVPEYEKYTVGGDKFLYDTFNNTDTASLPFPEKFGLFAFFNQVRTINAQDYYISFEYSNDSNTYPSGINSVIFRLSNTANTNTYNGSSNIPVVNNNDPMTLSVNGSGEFELRRLVWVGSPLFSNLVTTLNCGPAANGIITIYENSGGVTVKLNDTIIGTSGPFEIRVAFNQMQMYAQDFPPYTFDNFMFKIGTDENGVPGITSTDRHTVAYYSFDGTLNDTNNFDPTGSSDITTEFTEVVDGTLVVDANVDFEAISINTIVVNVVGNTLTDFEPASATMTIVANATTSATAESSVVTLFDSTINALFDFDTSASSLFSDVTTAGRTRDINTSITATFILESQLSDLLDKIATGVVYTIPAEVREYTIVSESRQFIIDDEE